MPESKLTASQEEKLNRLLENAKGLQSGSRSAILKFMADAHDLCDDVNGQSRLTRWKGRTALYLGYHQSQLQDRWQNLIRSVIFFYALLFCVREGFHCLSIWSGRTAEATRRMAVKLNEESRKRRSVWLRYMAIEMMRFYKEESE
jgi:hypothetical protein